MTELVVLTGPPCSGKSTHVRQHAGPRDVVIDLDLLAAALGYPHDHVRFDDAHPAIALARATRLQLIKDAVAGRIRAPRVWIIDAAPHVAARKSYERAGARVIHLTASAAELHRRADAAGRHPDTHRRIDDWSRTPSARSPAALDLFR